MDEPDTWSDYGFALVRGSVDRLGLPADQTSTVGARLESQRELVGTHSGVVCRTWAGRTTPAQPLSPEARRALQREVDAAVQAMPLERRTSLRHMAKLVALEPDPTEREDLTRDFATRASEALLEHGPLKRLLDQLAASEGTDPVVGAVVDGKFEIEHRLGTGGFGTVYRARHTLLGRAVALKLLHPELARRDGAERLFLREVELATSFVHRYAVQVREFGHDAKNGWLYFTMDLVEGATLRAVLREETRLDPRRALRFAVQALEALEEAHRRGVVHRDLKPENLLITEQQGEEEVRILDFGIGKALKALGGGETQNPTKPEELKGTPAYMAPEQFGGRRVDPRCDVYAMGVVLYEALAGQRPIAASHRGGVYSLMLKLMTDPARPLSEVVRGVPPELEVAVMRALERDPNERFASASAFADALRHVNLAGCTQALSAVEASNAPLANAPPPGAWDGVESEAKTAPPGSRRPASTDDPEPDHVSLSGDRTAWGTATGVLPIAAAEAADETSWFEPEDEAPPTTLPPSAAPDQAPARRGDGWGRLVAVGVGVALGVLGSRWGGDPEPNQPPEPGVAGVTSEATPPVASVEEKTPSRSGLEQRLGPQEAKPVRRHGALAWAKSLTQWRWDPKRLEEAGKRRVRVWGESLEDFEFLLGEEVLRVEWGGDGRSVELELPGALSPGTHKIAVRPLVSGRYGVWLPVEVGH